MLESSRLSGLSGSCKLVASCVKHVSIRAKREVWLRHEEVILQHSMTSQGM